MYEDVMIRLKMSVIADSIVIFTGEWGLKYKDKNFNIEKKGVTK